MMTICEIWYFLVNNKWKIYELQAYIYNYILFCILQPVYKSLCKMRLVYGGLPNWGKYTGLQCLCGLCRSVRVIMHPSYSLFGLSFSPAINTCLLLRLLVFDLPQGNQHYVFPFHMINPHYICPVTCDVTWHNILIIYL